MGKTLPSPRKVRSKPRSRRRRIALWSATGLALVIGALAIAGSVRDTHVVTVTRSTTADRDTLWRLWSDIPERPKWDKGLEYIHADGPFEAGTTGKVKVEGQGPIDYEIVDVDPKRSYTDRFNRLLGTHTDWHHEIEPRAGGGYDVTWRLEARGPLAIASLPVLKGVFGEEIPEAVDEYVELAESESPS